MSLILPLQKDELRRSLLKRREELPPDERRLAEKKIADALSAQAVMQGWSRVAVFLPWRAEPDLMATWRAWHARGIDLALPVVVAKDAPLLMQSWQPGAALIRDAMGLDVPKDTPELDCDIWLIPCVGIDRLGTRLGAGKGFYDRTVGQIKGKKPKLIGVCHSFAVGLAPFGEPHDCVLDACVSDAGWHEFKKPLP